MRKEDFCLCKNKGADQLAVTSKLIGAFVLATRIVQILFFPNQKCQASSHLLCLYSSVCVRPGRKPRRLVFSRRSSNNMHFLYFDIFLYTHNAPVICIPGSPGDSGDIAGLKCLALTSDVSRQRRGFAGVMISRQYTVTLIQIRF